MLFNQFCAETKAMNEKKAKSKESPVKGEHIEKDGGGGRGPGIDEILFCYSYLEVAFRCAVL